MSDKDGVVASRALSIEYPGLFLTLPQGMREQRDDGFQTHHFLFGAAGGAATGRSAASAGGAGSALKLSADGKSESRHDPMNLFALTFGTGNLF